MPGPMGAGAIVLLRAHEHKLRLAVSETQKERTRAAELWIHTDAALRALGTERQRSSRLEQLQSLETQRKARNGSEKEEPAARTEVEDGLVLRPGLINPIVRVEPPVVCACSRNC